MDIHLNYINCRRRSVWTSCRTPQTGTSDRMAMGVDFIAVVGDIIYFFRDWPGGDSHLGVVALGAERGRVYDWCFSSVLVASDRRGGVGKLESLILPQQSDR